MCLRLLLYFIQFSLPCANHCGTGKVWLERDHVVRISKPAAVCEMRMLI